MAAVNESTPIHHLIARLSLILAAAGAVSAADWPMWRYDASRSASSPEVLPESLVELWTLELPALEPAWPDEPRLDFDECYQPVVAGGLLLVGSPHADWVAAFEIASGERRWRFFTGGPVRFAPAVSSERVFVTSDDGHLYCLELATGRLIWKHDGAPRKRRALGNGRVISSWPARGGPVVGDGTVYYAAGIWPFMGVFVFALDVETGALRWTSDTGGGLFIKQPHNSEAFAGLAPQGALALTKDHVIVPNGRSIPAVLRRDDGSLIHFRLDDNHRSEDHHVTVAPPFVFNADRVLDLHSGVEVGELRHERGAAHAGGLYTATIEGEGKNVQLVVRAERLEVEHQLSSEELHVVWRDPIRAIQHELLVENGKVASITRTRGEESRLLESEAYKVESRYKAVDGKERRAIKLVFKDRLRRENDAKRGEGERRSCDYNAWFYLDAEGDVRVETRIRFRRRKRDKRVFTGELPRLAALRKAGQTSTIDLATAPDLSAEAETKTRWKVKLELDRPTESRPVVVCAGTHVFAAAEGVVAQIRSPLYAKEARSTWQETVAGTPGALLVADQRLFVVTRAGRVHCFGAESLKTPSEAIAKIAAPSSPAALDPAVNELKTRIARFSSAPRTAVVLGRDAAPVASALADDTTLALETLLLASTTDAHELHRLREGLVSDAKSLGRVHVLADSIQNAALPPYFADVVVALSSPNGSQFDAWSKALFQILKPHRGVALLRLARGETERLGELAQSDALAGARVEVEDDIVVLRRTQAPAGAGQWTHQHGDASNTLFSRDTLVRPPFGVLWFGGASNQGVLPRHGHGPSPQAVAGRVIIEGPHQLRALDLYTGDVLWEKSLPGIGRAYDNTEHQPGANALGSNYVTLERDVYVAHRAAILRLDAANGQTAGEFELPDGAPPSWLAIRGDVLVTASGRRAAWDPGFLPHEFRSIKPKEIWRYLGLAAEWGSFVKKPRPGTPPIDSLVEVWNDLIARPDMQKHLPRDRREKVLEDKRKKPLFEELVKKIEALNARATPADDDKQGGGKNAERPPEYDVELRSLNRELLALCYDGLDPAPSKTPGAKDNWDGAVGALLFGLDRHSGKTLWTITAQQGFRNNAVCLGEERIYVIDRLPDPILWRFKRRGKEPEGKARVAAYDLASGEPVWQGDDEVFGTWLGYSAEHDILLEAGRPSKDALRDEPGDKMAAYRGATGELLWRVDANYKGPCILHGDTIITEKRFFDLLTGKRREITSPVTGEPARWRYERKYGCSFAIASEHLLTFRSSAAGYYDLSSLGTGNLGGFRSGCSANVLPAGGVLVAPDYTRTCTCSFQNQTSIAVVHDPHADQWTFTELPIDRRKMRRIGINLGAPGDRRAPSGTQWFDVPEIGGPSPGLPVELDPDEPRAFRVHPSRVHSDAPEGEAWVGASGALGLKTLRLRWKKKSDDRRVTVRLSFIEPADKKPGERVFDVYLQNKLAIEALDVAARTGEALRMDVHEFKNVAARERVKIELRPNARTPEAETVLCGVEVVVE